MHQQPNDGGTTWILRAGDSLSEVPEQVADALTPEILRAFKNPKEFFTEIAERLPCRSLSAWLNKLIASGYWRLMLAETFMMEREVRGAFRWSSNADQGVMLAPGSGDARSGTLFHELTWIHWGAFAWSGGLLSPEEQPTLNQWGIERSVLGHSPADCLMVGNVSSGDILSLTPSGEGAFVSHENQKSYRLGMEAEMWEWVFSELMQGREPEFDYSRV